MEKYYWISYEHVTRFGVDKRDEVIQEHPFKGRERLRNDNNGSYTILNYKKITKQEYEMFNLELKDM